MELKYLSGNKTPKTCVHGSIFHNGTLWDVPSLPPSSIRVASHEKTLLLSIILVG